jgi:hypothetical protein
MNQSQKSQVNGELLGHPVDSDQEFLNKNVKNENESKRNNWDELGINQVTGEQINTNRETIGQEEGYVNQSAELGEYELEGTDNESMFEDGVEKRAREEPTEEIKEKKYG